MKTCLLDTNAISNLVSRDERMKPSVRREVLACHRVLISSISFYEIGQKVRLGKWKEMAPLIDQLEFRLVEDGFSVVPVSATVARHAAGLDWANRDPFDRIIAATAMNEECPVVSSDAAFDALTLARVW